MPSSRRIPEPAAGGVLADGSSEATTTRAIPASRIASVHGGVRPWWQHGSSDTYSVAPVEVAPVGGADRLHLGVRPAAAARWIALPEDLVLAADHRAHQRIRADLSATTAGQVDRAGEVAAIDIAGGGHGANQHMTRWSMEINGGASWDGRRRLAAAP